MQIGVKLAERGMVPELGLRWGIRRLLRKRLRQETARFEDREAAMKSWLAQMDASPVALATDAANRQHYEVPSRFYELVLGGRLKYSCALWTDAQTLDEAEEAMLRLTMQRARLADGQRILELGCGWGSLTLAMARSLPGSRIVAVSNSRAQAAYILERARRGGLANVEVRTADMNHFDTAECFDRVVSVEMFEHMRNWRALLGRICGWLRPDGRVFVHVFCHRRFAYPFVSEGSDDWMARRYFTGGMMPSQDLLMRLDSPLCVEAQWQVDGSHYARTAEAWYARLRARRGEVLDVFASGVGQAGAALEYRRWGLFFLACAELFGFRNGQEWLVSHYRLAPAASR